MKFILSVIFYAFCAVVPLSEGACPKISCPFRCGPKEYRRVNIKGCETCDCFDPCEKMNCPSTSTCDVRMECIYPYPSPCYSYPRAKCINHNELSTKCPNNQVWNPCTAPCTKTCKVPNPKCPHTCVARCDCPADKPLKRDDGMCVPLEDCLNNTCEGGKVWTYCASCEWTCDNLDQSCRGICESKCACPPDRPIWNNGTCTTRQECLPKCTDGKVWTPCGRCEVTCETINQECNTKCQPKCACPPERPIWKEGKCVVKDECAKDCPGGQVWNMCAPNCVETCDSASAVCKSGCIARCACPDYKPIWHNGECITKSQCPRCSHPQVWKSCTQNCTATCDNLAPDCDYVAQCVEKCVCPPALPVLQDKSCILPEQCPPKCNGGMVWNDCGRRCLPHCNSDVVFASNSDCVDATCTPRCECPPTKPFWDKQLLVCLTRTDCMIRASAN